eukprot:scaffold12001_cov14-Tisochrysis_lutea.AAC.1
MQTIITSYNIMSTKNDQNQRTPYRALGLRSPQKGPPAVNPRQKGWRGPLGADPASMDIGGAYCFA